MKTYTDEHAPARAVIRRTFTSTGRWGYEVTWYWPEKKSRWLPQGLTLSCGHAHRELHIADACARSRGQDIEIDHQ